MTIAPSSAFGPDPQRVQEFDALMRLRLCDSLRYLHEVSSDRVDMPAAMLEAGITRLLDHPVSPDAFAAYYELVYAIQDGHFQPAELLFREILESPACTGLELIPFLDPATDSRSQRYLRPVDSDPDQPFAIQPITTEDFHRASGLIHQAFDLLREFDPPLHDEIKALLKTIMIGAGSKDKSARTFDGASAFELWGSILLNAIEAKDIVDMVQTLAHESCHVMLFGYCIDDLLVLNPDSERYPSPLRSDPRPIDGIFHATFVLARMHYASSVLCEKSRLEPSLIEKADAGRRGFSARFYDGLATLKQHARYTDHGKALIANAEAYMNKHALAPPPASR